MKNVTNSAQLAAVITLALVSGVGGSFAYNTYLEPESKPNYAILDIEQAITEVTLPKLQNTTDPQQVKLIMQQGRQQVEHWIGTRLETYCASPCVVFNKTDVVFGDVVNLNRKFKQEVFNRK